MSYEVQLGKLAIKVGSAVEILALVETQELPGVNGKPGKKVAFSIASPPERANVEDISEGLTKDRIREIVGNLTPGAKEMLILASQAEGGRATRAFVRKRMGGNAKSAALAMGQAVRHATRMFVEKGLNPDNFFRYVKPTPRRGR